MQVLVNVGMHRSTSTTSVNGCLLIQTAVVSPTDHLADRYEALSHDWKLVVFYNPGRKISGLSP